MKMSKKALLSVEKGHTEKGEYEILKKLNRKK